jgi:uncharacterized protein (TIGR03067 family)
MFFWSLMCANGQQPEAKKEDPTADNFAKMQGKWQVSETENQGTVYKSRGNGAVILIDKSFMIYLDGDGKPCGKDSIKLDSSRSPKRMALTVVFNNIFPDTKGKTSQSVYQLEGDELKIATTFAPFQGYPGGFTTTKLCRFNVTTYKRIQP